MQSANLIHRSIRIANYTYLFSQDYNQSAFTYKISNLKALDDIYGHYAWHRRYQKPHATVLQKNRKRWSRYERKRNEICTLPNTKSTSISTENESATVYWLEITYLKTPRHYLWQQAFNRQNNGTLSVWNEILTAKRERSRLAMWELHLNCIVKTLHLLMVYFFTALWPQSTTMDSWNSPSLGMNRWHYFSSPR